MNISWRISSETKGNSMKPIGRALLGIVLAVSFVLAAAGSIAALEVGQKAPDFELDSSKGGKLKLSDLKGKNVLINFYVLDFSPT
jgi:cytochrome oxidase Cu insertion factor (SCO1/SenC/PrrC family)